MKANFSILSILFASLFSLNSYAATLKINFDKKTPEKLTLVTISQSGSTKSKSIAKGRKSVSINISGTGSQVFLRKEDGSLVAIAAKSCASSGSNCSSSKVAPFLVQGTFNVSGIDGVKNLSVSSDKPNSKAVQTSRVLIASINRAKNYKNSVNKRNTYKKSTFAQNVATNGQKRASTSSTSINALVSGKALTLDKDNDAIPDPLDIDNDGDTILDNYDTSASDNSGRANDVSFSIFSNLKASIESSINLHSTGLSSSSIDSKLQAQQTLAIEVRTDASDTAELDCGSLGYCSSGGTGRAVDDNDSFPGTPGGERDVDGDGLGELSKGTTGDFQLATGATTSSISRGDTLIQNVTSGSSTKTYSGLLNFIFVSHPAIKNVSVNSGATQTLDYTVPASVLGAPTNCISVPSTGNVSVTLTGWRPQRPGNTTIGESEYMDIGKSNIVIDIPNLPCVLSGGGGCSGVGPGQCAVSSYSTSDSNLSVDTNGLKDSFSDSASNVSNTYTFTIDLTTCLNNASGGAVPWNSNESLFVDLQFRSNYGDNAAQKFCVKRDA